MEFLTISLIIIACCGLYCHLKKRLNYFAEHGIPYVPGWLLLGNMASLTFRLRHIYDELQEVYNVNPEAKYVGFLDFTTPVIMLRDLELIKAVSIKHFDHFPEHRLYFDERTDPLFAGNLFSMSGEKWREARNMLSPAFTSSKMKLMFELMLGCARNVVDSITERPEQDNQMVGTKELFTKYTNDVIATCAFGIEVDSFKNPDNQFYSLGKEATNLESKLLKFMLARVSPFLTNLFNIKFIDKPVADFFKNIVSTTVKVREEKAIRRPDMLQLMMDARAKRSKHLKLDVDEMTAQAFVFFLAGFDSTSSLMCVLAHELAINPDVQSRLREEIEQVSSEANGQVSYDAINAMEYLEAVISEALRRHTLNPFFDRKCRRAFQLPPALVGGKPFVVQPGMTLWIPSSSIHLDPKYYDEPKRFDPDRFYLKRAASSDLCNLAFGLGPRSCIGSRFALLETKILFFFLLAKFRLKPNDKTCNPLTYSKQSFTVTPKQGFWLSIEKIN